MKHWKFQATALIIVIAALLTGTLGLVNSEDVNGGNGMPAALSRLITAFTRSAPWGDAGPAETAVPVETDVPADPGEGVTGEYETPPTAEPAPTGGVVLPVGGVNIAISDSDSKGNPAQNRVENVSPNQRIPKDFHVDNQGSADAFVFLAVTVPYVTIASQKDDGTYLPPMAQPLYSFRTNPGWTLVEDSVSGDRATYVYAYATGSGEGEMTVLHPNASTGRLFDELVTLNYVEGTVDGAEKEVVAQAYAIQAQNLGEANNTPDAIWALVKNAEASKSVLGQN